MSGSGENSEPAATLLDSRRRNFQYAVVAANIRNRNELEIDPCRPVAARHDSEVPTFANLSDARTDTSERLDSTGRFWRAVQTLQSHPFYVLDSSPVRRVTSECLACRDYSPCSENSTSTQCAQTAQLLRTKHRTIDQWFRSCCLSPDSANVLRCDKSLAWAEAENVVVRRQAFSANGGQGSAS